MKRKTNKDKGFTLVELIVVLVILAILAAILVPALLGYIDRAKEKQYVLNAKSALTATQAEFSSLYGEGAALVDDNGKFVRSAIVEKTADTPNGTEFYVLLCEDKEDNDGNSLGATPTNHDRYTVKAAYYVEKGYICVFNGSTWTTTETDSAPDASEISIAGVSFETEWTQIYPAEANQEP